MNLNDTLSLSRTMPRPGEAFPMVLGVTEERCALCLKDGDTLALQLYSTDTELKLAESMFGFMYDGLSSGDRGNSIALCESCRSLTSLGMEGLWNTPAVLVPCSPIIEFIFKYLEDHYSTIDEMSMDRVLQELENRPEELDPEGAYLPFLHCYELLTLRPAEVRPFVVEQCPSPSVLGSPPRPYIIIDSSEMPEAHSATSRGTISVRHRSDIDSTTPRVLWRMRGPSLGAIMTVAMRTVMLHPRLSLENFKLYDEVVCLADLCRETIGPIGRSRREFRKVRTIASLHHRRPSGKEGMMRPVLALNASL